MDESDFGEFLKKAFEEAQTRRYVGDEVEILEILGKGAFGTVYKGIIKESNEQVAIKCLEELDKKKRDEVLKDVLNELKAMTKVPHDKIPKFYGVYQGKLDNVETIGLIFTFIEGTPLDKIIIESLEDYTNLRKVRIAIQLVEIMTALHKEKITHRDIKPSNIMIKKDDTLILLDFGISKVSERTMAYTNNVKCTPRYSPPEAMMETGDDEIEYSITPKFDVWSMGALIIELFTGIAPWSKKFNDNNKIMMALMKGITYTVGNDKSKKYDFPYYKEFHTKFPEVFEVVQHCLIRDLSKRYSSEELLLALKKLEQIYI